MHLRYMYITTAHYPAFPILPLSMFSENTTIMGFLNVFRVDGPEGCSGGSGTKQRAAPSASQNGGGRYGRVRASDSALYDGGSESQVVVEDLGVSG